MKRIWLVLMLLLASCSGVNFQKIVDEYPGKSVSINHLSGESAGLFKESASSFCNLTESEFYRVEISDSESTITRVIGMDGKQLCEIDSSSPEYAENSVALTVNRESIYLAEIQEAAASLPEQQRDQGLSQVVDTMINRILLKQEAERRQVSATNEEIEANLQLAVSNSDISMEQIDAGNMLLLREQMQDRIVVQKLIDQVISEVEVTEQEIREYYNEENLMMPPSWTIRHIQLNIGEREDENARERAETVYGLLNTTDFCDLVEQFSDDTSSTVRCGRNTFSSGQMIPSVEEEVKGMQINETRIVRSGQAYHILQLLSENPERQAGYQEVKGQVKTLLLLQKQQQALTGFINQLRRDAEVVSYLN